MIKPELVIFDMDGLIFDSETLFMKCLKSTALKYGYVITRDMYLQTIGLGGTLLIEKMKSLFGNDYPIEQINVEARKEMNICIEKNELCVKKGIRELLTYLNKQNIKCCVASSTKTEFVKLYLDKVGLLEYFCEITGGESVTKSKPEPDIFILSCKKCKTEPQSALVLEDSENGIRAAKRAGIPVICIPDMKIPSQTDPETVCTCIESADKLIDVLVNKY